MADMKTLAALMRELEDRLMVCMRCGMCQAVCPVHGQTKRESDVARGKLALLDGLMGEMFKDPKGVYDRLNRCLLCGSCAANCPSGVNAPEIFIRARAIITGVMGLSPVKRAVLRGMLANPGIFDRLTEWGARFQKIFTRPANDIIGTSCARMVTPLLSGRHFRPLAEVPFHRLAGSLETDAGNRELKVAFFVGCVIDKVFPEVAVATVKALNHHRADVVIPKDQACCGIPALSSGDMKTFLDLVRYNLTLFNAGSFDCLVTACATCTATIRETWPRLVPDDMPLLKRKVQELADKTRDISQLLVDTAGITSRAAAEDKSGVPVTYHDPCHLKKTLGIYSEPRLVIQAGGRYRLREMETPDACCGMGGSFNLLHYDLSSGIGMLKRDQVLATGCGIVATGCPACMLQLSDMLSRGGCSVAVKHAVELYADSL